jgi:hypothetical protein
MSLRQRRCLRELLAISLGCAAMDMTAPNKAESAAKSEILEHVKSGLAHRRR